MRSPHTILALAVAAFGTLAGAFTTGCGSDCTKTLTCGENFQQNAGGAGGLDNSGGATTTTTNVGGATTTTTNVGGATTTSGTGGTGGGDTLLPLGDPCTEDTACDSGLCADGVCCDAACEGTCAACNLAGSEGTCTPHPEGTDPEAECGIATCDGSGECGVGQELWASQFGDGDNQAVNAVAVDASNNIYIAGAFAGSMTIGSVTLNSAGGDDIFVAKLAATGAVIWAKRFGDAGTQRATMITIGGNRLYIGGSYTGAPSFDGNALASSSSSGWYAAGIDSATGACSWVTGQANNPAPMTISQQQIHSIGYRAPYVYAVTSATGAGNTLRKLNYASGGLIDSVNLDRAPKSIVAASNGDLIIAGTFGGTVSFAGGPSLTAAGLDGFVVRLTTSFVHVWTVQVGGPGADWLTSVALASDGTVMASGYSDAAFSFGNGQVTNAGGDDAFIATITTGGLPSDAISFGGLGDEAFSGVAASSDGIVLAGTSTGDVTIANQLYASAGGTDAFVLKLASPSLVPSWFVRAGGGDDQHATAIAVDGLDRIAVAGRFKETIDFGSALTSVGNDDAFLVQLSP